MFRAAWRSNSASLCPRERAALVSNSILEHAVIAAAWACGEASIPIVQPSLTLELGAAFEAPKGRAN
jgi:hypothetical protein